MHSSSSIMQSSAIILGALLFSFSIMGISLFLRSRVCCIGMADDDREEVDAAITLELLYMTAELLGIAALFFMTMPPEALLAQDNAYLVTPLYPYPGIPPPPQDGMPPA